MRKRPDMLVLIAVWQFISAAGSLIGIASIAVFAFPYVWDPGGVFGLTVAVVTLACYTAFAVAGGVGLLIGKEWGRILSIVHAALSTLAVPVGTIIGVLSIVYLVKPEVRTYFSPGS